MPAREFDECDEPLLEVLLPCIACLISLINELGVVLRRFRGSILLPSSQTGLMSELFRSGLENESEPTCSAMSHDRSFSERMVSFR